jgi:uncharacterized protein YndB with AHSA1/START domain
MPDIQHSFSVRGDAEQVFRAFASPEGLNAWWTLTCEGSPALGAVYQLGFGPEYQWKAEVIRFDQPRAITWRITQADADWTGTEVGAELSTHGDRVQVEFCHTGWPSANAHFRISSFCWATYLRLLRRYVEFGEIVPYPERDSV